MGNIKQIKIEPIASNSFAGLQEKTDKTQISSREEVIPERTRISGNHFGTRLQKK